MKNEYTNNAIKGLLPYEMMDCVLYDLDGEQIENFARQFEKSQFVVLSGNSGIGKTSFLNCIFGESFYDRTGFTDKHIIVSIRPGIDPVKSMATALSTVAFSDKKQRTGFVKETIDLLNASSNGLYNLFLEYPVKNGYQLVFVIDPLDDSFMFTNVVVKSGLENHKQQVDNFMNLLCTFEKKSITLPVKTVVAFSNIFPEKIGRYPRFSDLVEKNSFVFKGVSIERASEVIQKLLPESFSTLEDIDVFKDKIVADLRKEYSNTIEWLFFLQHALKKTFQKVLASEKEVSVKLLLSCYDEIGGVKSSIEFEANAIYNESIKKVDSAIDRQYKGNLSKIFEFFFRAMIDARGEFTPRTYQNIVDMSASFYTHDREYIEAELIMPMIKLFSDDGLGLFEIVYSVDESERAYARANNTYLANSDIISMRNKILITKWSQWRVFQNLKIKLLTEYEWYSKISFEQKRSNNYNYPTTLQAYALHQIQEEDRALIKESSGNATSANAEEFNVINELLEVNDSWVDNAGIEFSGGFSNIAETQAYIKAGINYWKNKIEQETVERLAKIRRATIRSRYIIISFFIFLFVVYPLYRYKVQQFDDLKSRFDCMVSENNRMIAYLDNMQINKLSEYALCTKIKEATVKSLNSYTQELRYILQNNSDSVLQRSTELYNLNEFQYILNSGTWFYIADTCRQRDSILFTTIYGNVLTSTKILTVDTSDYDLYKKYKMNPDSMIAADALLYPRVPYFVSYDSLSKKTEVLSSDSTKTIYEIPFIRNMPVNKKMEIPYFLNCTECAEESSAKRITIRIE
jgi:energy-coupling factor transporter ATP-binding protein EcfA2